MAGPGGQECVQILGSSERMTSQDRNEVIGLIQEHLSLEATKNRRSLIIDEAPDINYHGSHPPLWNSYLQCRIIKILEGFKQYTQKAVIVATTSWECPEFLKSRDKWILIKTRIHHGLNRKMKNIQVYISEENENEVEHPTQGEYLFSREILLQKRGGFSSFWLRCLIPSELLKA